MTKKEFKQFMTELMEIKKATDNLNNSLRVFEPDFNYFGLTRYESLVVDILKNVMNDKSDWIGYWLYELDCGKKAKSSSVKKNGKNILIKTIDNLYDCIKNI